MSASILFTLELNFYLGTLTPETPSGFPKVSNLQLYIFRSMQELCDEEWIQVHYKTLIHMENSGFGDHSENTVGSHWIYIYIIWIYIYIIYNVNV